MDFVHRVVGRFVPHGCGEHLAGQQGSENNLLTVRYNFAVWLHGIEASPKEKGANVVVPS